MKKLLWFTVAAAAGILLSMTLARLHHTAENEHPAVAAGQDGQDADASDWDTIRQWLEHPFDGGDRRIRFRILQPGVILPPGTGTRPHVPADMTIAITRHGDHPARISVRQGDKSWEVSEEELDKLPAEVRPYVEQLLGPLWSTPAGGQKVFDLVPRWPAASESGSVGVPLEDHLGEPWKEKLEQMNRQMEQLRRQVEDLSTDQP